MRYVPTSALALAFALGLLGAVYIPGTVTAAVTTDAPTTNWQATLVNLVTGSRHAWRTHTWDSKSRCEAALGTWPEVLAAVAANSPDVKEPEGADQLLHESLLKVVLAIYQNTGQLPQLGIECEPEGSPA